MEPNVSRLHGSHELTRRRTLRDHVLHLVERHGEDYIVEGKRLLRRLVRTVTVVGALLMVLAGSLVVLVIRDVLR